MGRNSSAATLQSRVAAPSVVAASTDAHQPRPLLLGNFHGRYGTPCVVEQLAARLREEANLRPVCASHRYGALARTTHMLWTAWAQRGAYDVAVLDLFSGRAFRWGEAAAALLARLNKPFALVLRGGSLPEFAQQHPWRMRRTLQRATRLIAPSAFLKRRLASFVEAEREIEVLGNPLDLARYPFRLRRNPAPRLVWLRAYHAVYAPEMAVRVLSRLRAHVPEASLTLVGPDKGDGTRQRVAALAGELGLRDAVRMMPAVEKARVPEVLATADVFLNTTTADNTPVSVLEALACGLCVVSTNVGGIPDLLRHEHDALLVSPGDADAMAEAVRRLLEGPSLAARLSYNARATATASSWQHLLPRWVALLQEMRADKTPADSQSHG